MMMKRGRKVQGVIADSRLDYLVAIRVTLTGSFTSVDGFSTAACCQTTVHYAAWTAMRGAYRFNG